jgi:hypothetical protein
MNFVMYTELLKLFLINKKFLEKIYDHDRRVRISMAP